LAKRRVRPHGYIPAFYIAVQGGMDAAVNNALAEVLRLRKTSMYTTSTDAGCVQGVSL
jgi:hypothetical protein